MLAPNVVSLTSLISWLRTKDPGESYSFSSYSACAFAQYLGHHGYSTSTQEGWTLFELLHGKYMHIANPQPATRSQWTFGKALERALQMQEKLALQMQENSNVHQ